MVKSKIKKLTITNKTIAAFSILFGILFALWPFLLINEPHQYPGCVASDIFANGANSTSEVRSRFLLLHLVTIAFGSTLVGFGSIVIRNKYPSKKLFLLSVMTIFGTLISIGIIYSILTFSLSNWHCDNYNFHFNKLLQEIHN